MSERELREFVQHEDWCAITAYGNGAGVACSCNVGPALAAPPDVVEVLRMMSEWKERHIGSETGYAFAPPDVLLMTLEAAINDIEDEFHVRLTEDGWEWTDDEERDKGHARDELWAGDEPDCMP